MPKSDRTRVRHMLDAARGAMRSASQRTRSDLDTDLVWTLGLVKCIEPEIASSRWSLSREQGAHHLPVILRSPAFRATKDLGSSHGRLTA
jgi:hypothetical protein